MPDDHVDAELVPLIHCLNHLFRVLRLKLPDSVLLRAPTNRNHHLYSFFEVPSAYFRRTEAHCRQNPKYQSEHYYIYSPPLSLFDALFVGWAGELWSRYEFWVGLVRSVS